MLMTILKQSPSGTLKEAVRHQKVVLELQKWLLAAVDTKEFRLAFRVIESLDKLPIDLAALQVVAQQLATWSSPPRDREQ